MPSNKEISPPKYAPLATDDDRVTPEPVLRDDSKIHLLVECQHQVHNRRIGWQSNDYKDYGGDRASKIWPESIVRMAMAFDLASLTMFSFSTTLENEYRKQYNIDAAATVAWLKPRAVLDPLGDSRIGMSQQRWESSKVMGRLNLRELLAEVDEKGGYIICRTLSTEECDGDRRQPQSERMRSLSPDACRCQ